MRIIYAADIHAAPNLLADLIEGAPANKVQAVIVGGDIVPPHLPQFGRMALIEGQAAYLNTV